MKDEQWEAKLTDEQWETNRLYALWLKKNVTKEEFKKYIDDENYSFQDNGNHENDCTDKYGTKYCAICGREYDE